MKTSKKFHSVQVFGWINGWFDALHFAIFFRAEELLTSSSMNNRERIFLYISEC